MAKNDKTGKAGAKDDKAAVAKNDKTGKAGAKDDKATLAKNDKTGKAGAKEDKATPRPKRRPEGIPRACGAGQRDPIPGRRPLRPVRGSTASDERRVRQGQQHPPGAAPAG